uniref:Uncharacterized protein n=1 Tax=Oryza brachyantha TaxID=4533 RepID=J3NE23_ORYBR
MGLLTVGTGEGCDLEGVEVEIVHRGRGKKEFRQGKVGVWLGLRRRRGSATQGEGKGIEGVGGRIAHGGGQGGSTTGGEGEIVLAEGEGVGFGQERRGERRGEERRGEMGRGLLDLKHEQNSDFDPKTKTYG